MFEIKETIWNESTKRKLWIHLDNSHVHTSKLTNEKYAEYGFKRTPHPAYSPDVAPCDFFLFGFIKNKLKGKHFKDPDQIKETIIEILSNISQEQRKVIFEEWLCRCNWIVAHHGEYYHK